MKGYRYHRLAGVVLACGLCVATACTKGARLDTSPGQAVVSPAERDAQVRATLETYCETEVALKGSFFIYDPEKKALRSLEFDHVHEAVHKTPDGSFYACADFKDAEGNLLDLDVYTKGSPEEGWEIVRVSIHKENGVEREEPESEQ